MRHALALPQHTHARLFSPLPHTHPPTQVETVATTLALAEQNNARELKRVCLEFCSRHLQAVMATEVGAWRVGGWVGC